MKKNPLIHIKLDYEEAVQSKKDVLTTEIDLIKMAQAIKNYRILRLKELQMKIELLKKLKDTKTDITKIRSVMPKLEIPKILRKHEEEMKKEKKFVEAMDKIEEERSEGIFPEREEEPKEKKTGKKQEKIKPVKKQTDNLELQLKEIQDKLNALE